MSITERGGDPAIRIAREIMAAKRDPQAENTREEWLASSLLAHIEAMDAVGSLRAQLLPDAMCKEKGGLTKESRERCAAIVRAAIAKATGE